MRIYRLEEADKKKRKYFSKVKVENEKDREELISLYLRQEVPDNIIDWNRIDRYSYKELKDIVETFLKAHEEKKNQKKLSRAIEGRDYIKLFENNNEEGTEYLYLPLTWIGSKYLASDHFLPKIKVPSEQMDARDFSDSNAKNTDLSPGAKWCISLWTIPDLIIDGKPLKDEKGKEFRHEGKRYWLEYTYKGYYFLFYFRDYDTLYDTHKKIALTLKQGSSRIEDITLADDIEGEAYYSIERIQEYWDEHYSEYKSQIRHIQEVSKKDYPEFLEYEKQKEKEAKIHCKPYIKGYILRELLTYNKSTGRYDSYRNLNSEILKYLVEDGEFTVPLGVINGDFDCSSLGLKTLKNGPTEVEGYFDCMRNNLTSLEYAPKKIGKSFICSNNRLTTLEGAPKEVKGNFSCSNNKLSTLKGAPQKVGGSFNCKYNQLTTLEYAPKIVGGSFYCSGNNLTTLEGSPEYVGGDFYCSLNKLTTLEYAPEIVGGDFFCHRNSLQSNELPTDVKGIVHYSY